VLLIVYLYHYSISLLKCAPDYKYELENWFRAEYISFVLRFGFLTAFSIFPFHAGLIPILASVLNTRWAAYGTKQRLSDGTFLSRAVTSSHASVLCVCCCCVCACWWQWH